MPRCDDDGHVLDNQGLCHWCGKLLEPWMWDEYLNGPKGASDANSEQEAEGRPLDGDVLDEA